MDAVKYFKERERMCESFKTCDGCSFNPFQCCDYNFPEKAVRIVEQWSNEHPVITNRQKMIEVFGINGLDSADARPSWLDTEYKEPKGE